MVKTLGPGALRLILAILVVIHHSFPLRVGGFAVYVFFVLSGYWIAVMWEAKYTKLKQPYLTFAVSRWWRLAPIFFTCLLLAWLNSLLLLSAVQPPESITWWFRQIPIIGANWDGRLLPPTWSLDVEMQFYLLAPFFLFAFRKTGAVLFVVAAVLCLFSTFKHFWFGGAAEAPYLLPFASFFLAGVCIHRFQWQPSRKVAWATLAGFGIATCFLLAVPHTREGIWQVGSAAAGGLAGEAVWWPHLWWVFGVFACLPFVAWNVRQPSGKIDRWIGDLAYPLYLFHWIPRDWYYAVSGEIGSSMVKLIALSGNFLLAIIGAVILEITIDRWMNRKRSAWVRQRKPLGEVLAT